VDLHDRTPRTGKLRTIRRPGGQGTAAAGRSKCGSMVAEQPRGLGAVAKTLSMDMRANDRGWLASSSSTSLAKHRGRAKASRCPSRRTARRKLHARRWSSAFAQVIELPLSRSIGVFDKEDEPDAGASTRMFSLQGTEDRHRRHAVLDRRRLQPGHRRRLRPRPQGNHPARRRHPPVLGVALRQLPARARRPDQAPVTRHARPRPSLDRRQAEEASRLPGAARRLHGLHPRHPPADQLPPRPSPTLRN
jgi:hypothetical protein